ncbi:recombinase family protein [Bacillus sp. mrc49]|uniref:recombinase family protein n=1 Tax=Bacillus sp. mrc49 TaxID=2054913 RepID=UPI000C27C0B8|nr:hypothetical protein CVN76_27665 [Bacillus sp. mrc49]
MRLAFGYIRRSSYKQQNNNSVEIQKQHILEFAKRNKLNVPDEFIFIEDVTSAFSKRANQRKELMRLGQKCLKCRCQFSFFTMYLEWIGQATHLPLIFIDLCLKNYQILRSIQRNPIRQ